MTDERHGDGCGYCLDPDGVCIFPYYGLAPHAHAPGPMIGSTRIDPREAWPDTFREDDDAPGCGVYTRCPKCGSGTT